MRAGDLFGTRILSGDTYLEVSYGGEIVTRSIGFDPRWRVNLSFVNETYGPLVDQQIRLINVDDTRQIITKKTDINGTLIDHLPEGDWIIVVDSIRTEEELLKVHELKLMSPTKQQLTQIQLLPANYLPFQ